MYIKTHKCILDIFRDAYFLTFSVMLNMEVIYPSIEDTPESFPLEVPHENVNQEERTLQGNSHTFQNNFVQTDEESQRLLQVADQVEKTEKEQQIAQASEVESK